jgi:serine/threonine protein kinase
MEHRRDALVDEPVEETKRSAPGTNDRGSELGCQKPSVEEVTSTSGQTTPATTEGKPTAESTDSQEPSNERTEAFDDSPPPTIEKDQVIFGKYRLIEKIGEGGMGAVWLVHNVELDRKSALKLIKAEIAQNDKGWRRFRREAQLMAKLEHPSAVAVYDFKRSQGMGYIEMEFVRGRSLDRVVQEKQGEPLPLDMVADILDQLCSVLQEAHSYTDESSGKAKAIIHRDLKPSNLMIVDRKPPGQNLKVLDFGIAKMVEEDVQAATELTGAGDILGTPAYMSPEQIRGGRESGEARDIDGRSDLYSTGVMVYQLLTGVLPFRGNRMSILAAHLTKAPAPMKEANPKISVPLDVERVVMRCLEKDPEKRPKTARELAAQFRSAIGSPSIRPVASGKKSSGLPIVMGGAAAVVLILGLGIFWLMKSGSSTAGPAASSEQPSADAATTSKASTAEAGAPKVTADRQPAGEEQGVWSLPAAYRADAGELRGSEGPSTIVRTTDNVRFKRFKEGVYLPEGYEAKDPEDLVNGFPRVIARKDGAQFVRIAGGRYKQGDFRVGEPSNDNRGNPCTPHQVEVADFYIQETEVTNGEIAGYIELDARRDRWRQALNVTSETIKDEKAALKYPAVCLDRATAQRYARSVGGRLPTEAEWEYAARSQGLERRWAGLAKLAKDARPKANLRDNAIDLSVPVKTFPGDDETEQHVFDMTGNVKEWCADPYRSYEDLLRNQPKTEEAMKDPGLKAAVVAIDQGQDYVVRGGSFLVDSRSAMTFNRDGVKASEELSDLGFRVVIDCPRVVSPR